MHAPSKPLYLQIFHGGGFVAIGQVVTLALFFIAQRIILSGISTEANGILFIERRFTDLVMLILIDLGLNATVLRLCTQQPERYRTWISSALVIRISLSLVATIVCLFYAVGVGYSIINVGVWSAYLLISSKSGLLRYSIELRMRAEVFMKTIVATSILDALLFAVLIFVFRKVLNPTSIILCFFFSAIPGFLLTIYFNRTVFSLSSVSRSSVWLLLKQTIPLFLASVVATTQERVDVFFLESFVSLKEIGVYGAVSSSIAPFVSTVPVLIATILSPAIGRLFVTDRDQAIKYTLTSVRYVFLLSVCVGALSYGIAIALIFVVTNNTYTPYIHEFQMYLWISVPVYLLLVVSDLLVIFGSTKLALRGSILVAIVSIFAGLILIPVFGAIGAIETRIISAVLGAFYFLYALVSVLGTSINVGYVARCLVFVCIVILSSVILPLVAVWYVATALTVVIALVCAIVLRLVHRADVSLLQRMISHRLA